MATKHFYRLSCAALGIKFSGSYGECTRVIERAVGTVRADGRDLWQGFDRRRCNMAKQGDLAIEVVLMSVEGSDGNSIRYGFIIEAQKNRAPNYYEDTRANNRHAFDTAHVLKDVAFAWMLCQLDAEDAQVKIAPSTAHLAHLALLDVYLGFFGRAADKLTKIKGALGLERNCVGDMAISYQVACLTSYNQLSLYPRYTDFFL